MSKYIDKDVAVSEFKRLLYHRCGLSGAFVTTLLENMQTADDVVPVRHGKWQMHIGIGSLWKCSCCEYKIFRKTNKNYCPNCGAKMDGEAIT